MPVWLRPVRIALVVVALVAATAGAQPDRIDAPITLGIVRADGLIVPFASWDGKRWRNTWPVPEKTAGTPIATADVPKRWWAAQTPIEEWHVWQVNGSRTQALVRRPAWYLAHCQQGVGLATNLEVRQPAPPPVVQPYPKLGLASSAPLRFGPVAVLGPDSAVWKAIPGAIREHVNAEENRQASQMVLAGWKHPTEPEDRARVPVEVQALYRSPIGSGRFLYYFEAVKRHTLTDREGRAGDDPKRERPRRPGDDCSVVTFASGWFVAGNTDTALVTGTPAVRITSCDFAEVDVMLPLGYVSSEAGPVWIVQMSGWGRESFALLRVDPETRTPLPVIATHGGECPRVR